jgi:Fic family protein
MQTHQKWIWQHSDWSNFSYDLKQLLPELTNLSRLIGGLEATCQTLAGEVLLDTQIQVLADDAIETSAIEGEIIRRSSVRASIRKQLGLPIEHDDSDIRSDGLVAMLMDVRNNTKQELTEDMLFAWQAALFPTGYSGLDKINVGCYRGNEQMQIISGPIGKEKVHYIAPPRSQLQNEMNQFLSWINAVNETDPILKAGIAHLWLIMIHPFDDGNGRVSRAVTDYLLAKQFPWLMQIISFSKHVSLDKKGYYSVLEEAGKNNLDITNWLKWFLQTLITAMNDSAWIIEQVIKKTQFWNKHTDTPLNTRQHKVINRLLNDGDRFEGGMTTRKYASISKCSKATASRDLADLEIKKILKKRPGSGRSTSYEINFN